MAFFDLPFEIRSQIYSYVIRSDDCIDGLCRKQPPPLLLVNRASYEETRLLWYSPRIPHLAFEPTLTGDTDDSSICKRLKPAAFLIIDVHTGHLTPNAGGSKADNRIEHILIEINSLVSLNKEIPSVCIPDRSQHPLRSTLQHPFQHCQALKRLTIRLHPSFEHDQIELIIIKPPQRDMRERREVCYHARTNFRKTSGSQTFSSLVTDLILKDDFIIDWCLCAWERGWQVKDVKWAKREQHELPWYERDISDGGVMSLLAGPDPNEHPYSVEAQAQVLD